MTIRSWTATSLVRHYPSTPARRAGDLRLEAALNERTSFQVALRQEGDEPQWVCVEIQAPKGIRVRLRRVGYVPVRHHNTPILPDETDGLGMIPGYVPDPLFDEDQLLLPAGETHAFWVTLTPTRGAEPRVHGIKVIVAPERGRRQIHTVKLALHKATVGARKDFAVTHWFYNDALLDYYGCTAFDERYWEILPAYFRNMAEHGQDTVYTPVFTPTWGWLARAASRSWSGRTCSPSGA